MLFFVLGVRPATADAAVRVVDDEVVFTLRAPQAQRVFLVGDFNNWNPTLERMDKEGDVFIMRLYLLPGPHRYKFVVDGEWRVDPENLPRDPTKGSGFVLEERAGMLAMAGDVPLPDEGGEPELKPMLRYVGAFLDDSGDTSSDQALDFFASYQSKHIEAGVDMQSLSDTWELSPLTAQVLFAGGFIRAKFENGFFEAFENDTMWTSNDPFRTVGDVGIYDYNAGFDRKGFAFVSPKMLQTRVRLMYTDYFEQRLLTPVTIAAGDFDGFPGSATPDTLVYQFAPSFDDEDTWAIDVAADLGSIDLGYVYRENRGMNPGVLADVTRVTGAFATNTYNTRERWTGDVVWLDWNAYDHVTVGGGYGWSNASVQQTARSVAVDSTLGDVALGQDAQSFDGDIRFQTTRRWNGSLGYERGDLALQAVYRWNEFNFEGIAPSSTAQIQTVDLDARYRSERWSVGGHLRYIDQDNGDTPVDFQVFTPTRNYWLDWGDGLDVPGQVAFDMQTANNVRLVLGWNDRDYDLANPLRPVNPFALLLTIDEVSSALFDRLQVVTARLDGEYGITDRIYFDLHARVAHYDKSSWPLDSTFFAYYLESGYRDSRLSVSVSVGPDPVVLDLVPNAFRNNGWEQTLRQGIPPNLTREQAVELGQGLGASEQTLEDNHALKLELIVFF